MISRIIKVEVGANLTKTLIILDITKTKIIVLLYIEQKNKK